jgi:hypothetical protein
LVRLGAAEIRRPYLLLLDLCAALQVIKAITGATTATIF